MGLRRGRELPLARELQAQETQAQEPRAVQQALHPVRQALAQLPLQERLRQRGAKVTMGRPALTLVIARERICSGPKSWLMFVSEPCFLVSICKSSNSGIGYF